MKARYSDILSRVQEDPKWYDGYGVPRFDDFHPELCPDIYSHHVALVLIACQSCSQEFEVEMHASWFDSLNFHILHYGDPPIHDCVGDTMNCEDLAVLQAWLKPQASADEPYEWQRHPEFEGPIE